ncbi:MAG: ELP5 family protein [Nitrosopumilus sp.]|nr:ELP5 family protein [Nitrosopumilus sp.]
MLDKNPKQSFDDDFVQMKAEFSKKNPNFIFCSKPFLKTEFLNRFIESQKIPIIFLDFDLLYSGYVSSKMIKRKENVRIVRSDRINWERDLKEIIEKISRERVLVILDSLNGIYNMFDELESSRFINAAIMLLSSVARHTKSQIMVTAMVIKNDDEWILSPGGRHLMDSKESGVYFLGMSEANIILNKIDKNQPNLRSFEIKK